MKTKKKVKINLKNVIVGIILVVLVAVFYVNTSKPKQTVLSSKSSEYDKIMNVDMELAYPATPKEVVKYYSRAVKCLYNTRLSDKKVANLTERLRVLFDQELLNENPLGVQLEQLESDIKSYRKDKKSIISYIAGENSSVEYKTLDGE
ncbi:MAG: hypothetical protein Q4G59_12645, partial [Planctomycetia bacterium]|nr:hypothetical protein [Planctomycetia bacterium]